MRALLIGDVHLSDTPPSVRTETYAQDILDKLEWCMEYANNQSVDVIVQLGDMFHLKVPSRTSHGLVQRTARVLAKFNGRVLVVPGNHDEREDRIESLSSQPLGTLALSPNVELLDGYDEQTGIFGIPYMDDFNEFLMRVCAFCDGQYLDWIPTLFAAHASIFPPEDHPPYPHMNADKIFTKGVPLAYGHIHIPHGFYEVNGSWFCNNGAISRGSLHEETLHRKLAVTMFDSERKGCPFESIPIPFKPAEQVFRLDEHKEQEAKAERLDEFLHSVGDVSLTSLSLEEVISHAEANEGLSPEARTELKEIIESVL